jgi:hypothetical protein
MHGQREGILARRLHQVAAATPRGGAARSAHAPPPLTIEGPGSARVEIFDFALPSRELCAILRGYIAEMFVMAELRGLDVEESCCRLDGAGRCAWRVRWTPAPSGAAGR